MRLCLQRCLRALSQVCQFHPLQMQRFFQAGDRGECLVQLCATRGKLLLERVERLLRELCEAEHGLMAIAVADPAALGRRVLGQVRPHCVDLLQQEQPLPVCRLVLELLRQQPRLELGPLLLVLLPTPLSLERASPAVHGHGTT